MKFILMIVSLLILTSCASSKLDVDFVMPSARLQTPETSGERWHGKVNMSGESAHEVSLARSSQTRFIFGAVSNLNIETNTKVDSHVTLGLHANMGLAKRLDFVFRKNTESTYNGGFQFQFLGEPQNKREQGWKMSIASTYGYQEDKEFSGGLTSRTEEDDFQNVSARTVLNAWDVAMIVGYRANQYFMLYLNTFYEEYNIDSRFGIVGGTNYILDTDADNMGALAGMHFFFSDSSDGSQIFMQLEGGYSVAKVRGAPTHDQGSGAITLGANW